MILLKLQPQSASPRILAFLEKKNLIRTFKPPKKVLASQATNGAIQVIYCSRQRWGADKLKKDRLTEDDFIAVVFEHNDHKTCIFTMLRDTVHCEVALPGAGEGPVFFVAEPSRLQLKSFRTKGYKLTLKH